MPPDRSERGQHHTVWFVVGCQCGVGLFRNFSAVAVLQLVVVVLLGFLIYNVSTTLNRRNASYSDFVICEKFGKIQNINVILLSL